MDRPARPRRGSRRIAAPAISAVLLASLLVVGVRGCERRVHLGGEAEQDAAPGAIRSATRVGYLPAVAGRFLLSRTPLRDRMTLEHGVTLYRLEYWTVGPAGKATVATGLVAYPRGPMHGVVSYGHGTRSSREEVPSRKSREGLLAAIGFGGHGYLVAAPDYLGLGGSPGPHPYLHADTESRAVIDLLDAARRLTAELDRDWPDRLFLTGFSQGGHAAMAAQRALEREPRPDLRVTASAPVAGVYDLSGLVFPFALEGNSPRSSLYIGYVAASYASVYRHPLESLARSPWDEDLPQLFDGSLTLEEAVARLPKDPRILLREDFLEARVRGEDHWFLRALQDNDVDEWVPRAPVRLYYGSEDRDAPPADAMQAAEQMRARGGHATAIDTGPTDHNETIMAAVPRLLAWFDSLSAQARVRR